MQVIFLRVFQTLCIFCQHYFSLLSMDKITIPKSLGEHLHKELESQNKTEFARRIGISRKQLYNLIDNKRSLTIEVAKRIGEELGTDAKYWLDLEHEHRLYKNGIR